VQPLAPPAVPTVPQAPVLPFAGHAPHGSSSPGRKSAGRATASGPAGQAATPAAKPRAPFNKLLASLVCVTGAGNASPAPAVKKEDGSRAAFWMAATTATSQPSQPAKPADNAAETGDDGRTNDSLASELATAPTIANMAGGLREDAPEGAQTRDRKTGGAPAKDAAQAGSEELTPAASARSVAQAGAPEPGAVADGSDGWQDLSAASMILLRTSLAATLPADGQPSLKPGPTLGQGAAAKKPALKTEQSATAENRALGSQRQWVNRTRGRLNARLPRKRPRLRPPGNRPPNPRRGSRKHRPRNCRRARPGAARPGRW
jgi:hypothetical protein